MSKKTFASAAFYFLALAVFMIDQWVKLWVVDHMYLQQTKPLIDGFFALYYVQNIGAAFSAFSGQVWGLALIAGVVAIALIVYERRLVEPTLGHVVALGFLLGGTLGNFHDRIRFGHVVDMFDLQWHGHNIWPIFNVADMAIDGGVALLLLVFLWESREAARVLAAKSETPDSSPKAS